MGVSKAKIVAAVDKAFDSAGELASTATLSNKSATSYNFATGAVDSTTTKKTVQVIIVSKALMNGRSTYQSIIKSTSGIDSYDTLTIGTDVYSITDSQDNGFTIDATLTREA